MIHLTNTAFLPSQPDVSEDNNPGDPGIQQCGESGSSSKPGSECRAVIRPVANFPLRPVFRPRKGATVAPPFTRAPLNSCNSVASPFFPSSHCRPRGPFFCPRDAGKAKNVRMRWSRVNMSCGVPRDEHASHYLQHVCVLEPQLPHYEQAF